ncbi:phytanoyl-CoA dioxygenase family protein [Streptomyces olivochromogenes]|uniref:phytanoyl-CoA dioxygenase family protein n=1 Tax=Streptomyces olivochromogenes TaxID=1963 RepID=UPI001F332312|nr:phytanoyl-CoA dioxygenase family protein [Streptomyces olivochromogenes]MCF3131110.1 phytanoyl-CoA dioxygenase family protein [Streptomyces olivochromogenes]
MTERNAHPEVRNLEDLAGDLARTHRATNDSDHGHGVEPAQIQADLAALERDGYVILTDLLSREECDGLRDELTPLLGQSGRNAFEGHRTQRIYSVLNKTRRVDRLVGHPRVLALLDRLLLPNYLLSQLQVINIRPGEDAQLLHPDDGFYPVPRPRPELSVATVWAIDEFTADNGATVLIPGSHRWPDGRTPTDTDPRPTAVMPAGSCVVFVGTLWHGGGANRSAAPRLAATAQYCQPWLRTQEAFTLSTDRDVVREVSEDLRRMLGYSIHPPFVGMVDGMHPKRLLDRP